MARLDYVTFQKFQTKLAATVGLFGQGGSFAAVFQSGKNTAGCQQECPPSRNTTMGEGSTGGVASGIEGGALGVPNSNYSVGPLALQRLARRQVRWAWLEAAKMRAG